MAPIPEKRIEEFEKLGFGIFVHWGLYSQLGMGEWIMHLNKIPKEEYRKLFDSFTANDFDAERLVNLAKRAGAKYITFTTRHHDGFSLYDTKGLNEYDAPHSPAKRDLVKEFVDACHKNEILPFLYHTTLDWYEESFENDFDKYLDYLNKSVEILCTNYGEIGGFWFDGNWSKPPECWNEEVLYKIIRKHQPNAMIINNTGLGNGGKMGHIEIDSVTFEQSRAEPLNRENAPKYLASEVCQTMNKHWGIGKYDYNYKSLPELIETLCHSRSVGANYLLNISPDANGGILKMQEALLEQIGEWINVCGQSMYEGKPSKIICEEKDFVLDTKDASYIYVFNLPIIGHESVTIPGELSIGDRVLKNVNKKIKQISWVDNQEKLEFEQNIEMKTLKYYATGFPYGSSTFARVAKIEYLV